MNLNGIFRNSPKTADTMAGLSCAALISLLALGNIAVVIILVVVFVLLVSGQR